MLKRFALLLAVLTWPAIALAAFFSPCCYNNSLNVTFTHVEIVGAGAITGITSVPSANLLLARTDQYGCYKSVNNSQWSELVTTNAMPASAVTVAAGGPIDAGGCEELVGDPSNIQNLWIFFNKNIYLSTNGGTSFSSTCYPAQASDLSNTGPAKTMSPRIAVDPNNSNVVYFSTHSAGLEVTYNQGSTCTAISTATIAAPTSNSGFLVAFDPSGGTTTSCAGGVALCTKSIYVSSYGTGVYHSNDGGQTWTLTTGTPTTHLYMTVDSTGVLWFVDNSNNNGLGVAHKYAASAWAAPTFTHNNILTSVAFDPNNCSTSATCHVVFMIGGGGTTGGTTALTQNGGGAWAVATGYTPSTTDAPWLANVWTTIGLFPNGAAFDNSGHVYTGLEGVGFTTPPTTATTLTMTSQTLGIEEAEVSSLSTSPNTSGSLLAGNWDVGSFTLSAPYNSPPTSSNHGCAGQTSFQHAYSIDWAGANPSDFACLSDNQQGYIGGTYTSYSGLSSNGGSTWGTFTVPSAISTGGHIGGCMAASSSTNILWAPTDGSSGATAPLYTTDSGSTWNFISVSGVTQGWGIQYYFSGRFCAADRVNAGTFYLYNPNTGSGTPSDAFIKCTASGATCTRVSSPGFGPNEQINPILQTMPGQGGTFFFSYGTAGGSPAAGNGFYYSTDGGTTINTIANFSNVTAFGFGAAFSGHTMPAIVAVGYYNNVYGIWRSIDWDGAKTWQQIGTFPLGLPLAITSVDGDKVIPNVFFYGTKSSLLCSAPSPSYCNGST